MKQKAVSTLMAKESSGSLVDGAGVRPVAMGVESKTRSANS